MKQRASDSNLVILWRSLGPYHVARGEAASRLLSPRGIRTVLVELCDAEETRDWRAERSTDGCEVLTLAPGQKLTERSRDLSRVLLEKLNELNPICVAIAGYDRPEMRNALRWANRHRAGAILMSETKWDDRPRPWWRRILASREVRRADAALVSGGPAGEYLITLGMPRERVFRHYGAVDNSYFQKRAADPSRVEPGRNFLACCRLIEKRKNIMGLLSAYELYRQRTNLPWELVICGDGPDKAALHGFVRQRKIEGVTFAGFQQIDTLVHYYRDAGCFVHAAINEAWGLVVNEAMASGLPVLVSRRCGCAYDLVHEGVNGYSFDPHDVDELAMRMHEMADLADGQRKIMGAESQRIVAHFGTQAFANGLAAAMDSIGGRRRSAPRPPDPAKKVLHTDDSFITSTTTATK